ncbi:MAG: hypothetical protein AAB388_01420 [Patescibacteria group bacterium]
MPACQTNGRVVSSALDLMLKEVQSRKLNPRFQGSAASYNPVRHKVLGKLSIGSRNLCQLIHEQTEETKRILARANKLMRGTSEFTGVLQLLKARRDILELALQTTRQAIRTEFKLNPEDDFVVLSGWRVALLKAPPLPRLDDEEDDLSETKRPSLVLVANNG